jgi:hypothetical protein
MKLFLSFFFNLSLGPLGSLPDTDGTLRFVLGVPLLLDIFLRLHMTFVFDL